MAREALGTNWIKLEIHPDPRYLLPDPIETLAAAEQLVKDGFIVMPYINADPVLCKRLEEVGTACVMPLGAPDRIEPGTENPRPAENHHRTEQRPGRRRRRNRRPSHAAEAMEMGASAVLVNTAIAVAQGPVQMAVKAFKMAVEAGRMAYEAQLAPQTTASIGHQPVKPVFGRH